MDKEILYECLGCDKQLPIERFYSSKKSKRSSMCKTCTNRIEKQRYREKKNRCFCGSPQVSPRLNTYKDPQQKECTFTFLTSIGWKFNEEKGIWWKEGIKDKSGIFINIKVKPKKEKTNCNRNRVTPEIIKEVIELTNNGYSTKQLVPIIKLSSSTINIIKRNEGLSDRGNRNTK